MVLSTHYNCQLNERSQHTGDVSVSLLEMLLENSDDAIYSSTLDKTIVMWSRGAERLYGYLQSEMVGKSVEVLIPPDRIDEAKGIEERVARGEQVTHMETTRLTKSRHQIDVLLTAMPLINSSGKILHVLVISKDIAQSKREHIIAAQLQEAIIPPPPQQVQGFDLATYYKPALEEANVGGDFFDVFPIREDRIALVIGDLTGKGLAAAKQVATVRNYLRYALYHEYTVVEAITKLNRTLAEYHLLSDFATLFAAEYDPPTRSLNYFSCGHEPAILHHAKFNEIEQLQPTGPMLGIDMKAEYTEQHFVLSPGDALILYTDGLTDAGPNRSDLLGISGLCKILHTCRRTQSAIEIMSYLTTAAEDYTQGVGFHDDVCLLVVLISEDEQ